MEKKLSVTKRHTLSSDTQKSNQPVVKNDVEKFQQHMGNQRMGQRMRFANQERLNRKTISSERFVQRGTHDFTEENESKEMKDKEGVNEGQKEIAQDQVPQKENKMAPAVPKRIGGNNTIQEGSQAPSISNGGSGQSSNVVTVAMRFLRSVPTAIAKGINAFGKGLTDAMNQDTDGFHQQHPSISGSLSVRKTPTDEKSKRDQEMPTVTSKGWTPPNVQTDRNDAPKFAPSTESNPNQMDTAESVQNEEVQSLQGQTNSELKAHPGETLVQGQSSQPVQPLHVSPINETIETNRSESMNAYLAMDVPEMIRTRADKKVSGVFKGKLDGPNSGIRKVMETKDAKNRKTIEDHRLKAAQMSKKASDDQNDLIEKNRDAIVHEKDDRLEESKAILMKFRNSASEEKQKSISKIDDKIKESETQAAKELNTADQKSAEEKQKAEQQKAHERQVAESKKKKKKKGFFGKMGDFFKSVAKGLEKAITSIVKKVAQVVKAIVDTARKIANGIITACQKFVSTVIKAYGAAIKAIANVALAAFPGVRDRFNQFVDKVIAKTTEAVKQLADVLKDGINGLAETINNIVDAAVTAACALAKGFALMVTAIVEGDFASLPKIIFITGCEAAGVPGDLMWAIVLRALEEAKNIIKHPVNFAKNLVKACIKGFKQFGSNIGINIRTGLSMWLFGSVRQMGVDIPTTLDKPSMFTFTRQVLGLEYSYVRNRAVEKVGEDNVEKSEQVALYVKKVFDGGPNAVYDEVVKHNGGDQTSDQVLDKVEDWAIGEVIKRGIAKITSMFVPGLGFVSAIYSIWQTIQFIREKMRQIAALITSVLDSIHNIAIGALSAAANYIEKTLVQSLPLVFDWLAKQLGLGDVGAKIVKIIHTLRKPVNKVVDKTIEGIIKLIQKGKSLVKKGVAKAKNWWQKNKPFKTHKGESHNLLLNDASGKRLVPVIDDAGKTVASQLETWKNEINPSEQKQAYQLLSDARGLNDSLTETLSKVKSKPSSDDKSSGNDESLGQKISKLLQRLAEKMTALYDRFGAKEDVKGASADFEKNLSLNNATSKLKAFLNVLKMKYGLRAASFEIVDEQNGRAVVTLGKENPKQFKLARKASKPVQAKFEKGAKPKPELVEKKDSESGTHKGIPKKVRQKMEQSFNANFSNVQIHSNSGKAKQLGALAYTQGHDIHFASGQYNPETYQGQKLLGHELAHVVQQRNGRVKETVQMKGISVNTNPHLEREADRMGQMAANASLQSAFSRPSVAPSKQRVVQMASVIQKVIQFCKWGQLTLLSNGNSKSTEGLEYGKGSKQGNRIAHVLEHAKEDLTKPKHSVFNVKDTEVLGLIDEAWSKRTGVKPEKQMNGNDVYNIPMGKDVGTKGEKLIRIVVKSGTSEIVTGFPV